MAERIATELDVTGILAVELFETADGRLLVNELAMRPHNTGHWSIDGAVTSQFENHLRAVLDLPLGSTDARTPWSVMVNILGGAVEDLEAQRAVVLAAEPDVKIHLYGKSVKAGRKVGHVTAYGLRPRRRARPSPACGSTVHHRVARGSFLTAPATPSLRAPPLLLASLRSAISRR